MAKETAHQIGTPLSSLMAWLELLKKKDETKTMAHEMEKDIKRLETITDRFSKIGSKSEFGILFYEQRIISLFEVYSATQPARSMD